MLAAMASNTEIETIFVRLLDEGTDVMRPVQAAKVVSGNFRLIEPTDYDPEYETWEFTPDSIVRCEVRRIDDEMILVAVEGIDV
jgi:hypothetical protein